MAVTADDLATWEWTLLRLDVLTDPPETSTPWDYARRGVARRVANVPGPDGLVRVDDVVPAGTEPGRYAYVLQPVRTGIDAASDVDADGVADRDLDGDLQPEFVSRGSGSGLTGRIAGTRLPLVSADAALAVAPGDRDGDGVPDPDDDCPFTPDPLQEDGDGDGAGDACDPCPLDPADDADGDGACADADNCDDVPNPDQGDDDADGTGDACETAGVLLRLAGTRLDWTSDGARSFNVYRGTIPALSPRLGPASRYDHACHEARDAFGDGAFTSRDPERPGERRGFYYLVAPVFGAVEGSLGRASHDLDRAVPGVQLERPNRAPCP